MNTPMLTTAQVAAQQPSSMFNRGEQYEKRTSVLDSIHKIKIYNANPGQAANPELAGKILIKRVGSEEFEVLSNSVGINILAIRKAMNGVYSLLNPDGSVKKKSDGTTESAFAFTEEYFRYARNTDEVFFKDNNEMFVFTS